MSLTLALALILIGIVVLLFGGDLLIRGAVALAGRWKLPSLLVGLTIVAFGTSAPELVVSIDAALSGAPGLAVGNIVGSNIANVLFVLGVPALFGAIGTSSPGVKRNALIALIASGALIYAGRDGAIDLIEGAVLFACIVAFIGYLGLLSRRKPDDPMVAELLEAETAPGLPKSSATIALMLIVGIIALPGGAHMIVLGGSRAAELLGVSDTVIGLTVLALGTSLPEFATVLVAAFRRQADLAIGNVLGSNVFNVFAVGGGAALAAGAAGTELTVAASFMDFDFWVMLGASTLLFLWILTSRPIGRVMGGLLFLGYGAYIAALAYMNQIQLP
ncbi:calcium/sodium antiporter [Hyphobacterium marinum]|uniref:Calcium/sodium antiporter n=1 Tax=Hyphobacterium marinum TaxID=3116574 RepID=A0ABU7M0W1_9PROT|nr:calcium/sodium antiporter [Hyphobacterium sp. Y6023]MEE2567418.1 calcium/sodium antiporter [Hyphobacterium sp. Y6023]